MHEVLKTSRSERGRLIILRFTNFMFVIKVINTRYAVIIIIIVIISINYIVWKVSKLTRVKNIRDLTSSRRRASTVSIAFMLQLFMLSYKAPLVAAHNVIIINIHRRFWYEITHPIFSLRTDFIAKSSVVKEKKKTSKPVVRSISLVKLLRDTCVARMFRLISHPDDVRKFFANKKQYSLNDGSNKGRSSKLSRFYGECQKTIEGGNTQVYKKRKCVHKHCISV